MLVNCPEQWWNYDRTEIYVDLSKVTTAAAGVVWALVRAVGCCWLTVRALGRAFSALYSLG